MGEPDGQGTLGLNRVQCLDCSSLLGSGHHAVLHGLADSTVGSCLYMIFLCPSGGDSSGKSCL